MAITEINREVAKQIAAEAETALREVAERHGLTLKAGGGKFDPGAGTFSPKIEFALGDSEKREWDRSAFVYDLRPEDFGREFAAHGDTFRISGVSVRSPKRPILATNVKTNRRYKFDADHVKRLLDREQ